MSSADHEMIENVPGKSAQTTLLVTGSTGNVGRHVVSQLLRMGAAVRALTRNPDSAPARTFREWAVDHTDDFRSAEEPRQ
jgi:uncharacterized protein YbjT (DUF2867 family)